jgi:cold-inducible RNA-binding protein
MAKRIYVGGLPYSYADQDLESLFSAHGAVTSAQVVSDRYTGQSKGFGFVEMSDADATAAINTLNGKTVGGRSITVNEAKPREDRSSGGYSGGGGGGGRSRW